MADVFRATFGILVILAISALFYRIMSWIGNFFQFAERFLQLCHFLQKQIRKLCLQVRNLK